MGRLKDTKSVNWSEHFYYDPTSPSGLRRAKDWLLPKFGGELYMRKPKGSPAGHMLTKGYWAVYCEGQSYKCHRIVYELVHGPLEGRYIDHIDGDRSNNQVSNLRAVTSKENAKNRRKGRNNISGKVGVARKSHTHWVATWNDAAGRQRSKSFKIATYGDAEAFRLASEYRDSVVNTAAGYSERHGV